jgi:hypothetical protein
MYKFIAVIVCLGLYACDRDNCTYLSQVHTTINRQETVSPEKMYDGHLLEMDDNFRFKCMFLNGRQVTDVTPDIRNGGFVSIKLLKPEINRLRHNDTLRLFFVNNKPLLLNSAAIKQVRLIVKKEQTACDTVYNIIYEQIGNNIENIATNEKVTRVKLFDDTIKNSIQKYLQSLSKAGADKRYECPQNVFIADMLNHKDSFGFAENEYTLPPSLRHYLDVMAQSVADKLNEHKWENRRFTIDCIGFADQQRYTGSKQYSFRKMDIVDSAGLKVVNTGCGFVTGFALLESDSPDSRPPLISVIDNCDLSLLRSFVAIHYLRSQLQQLTEFPVIYRYKGGGEAPGTAFEVNRKIELSIEIKGVAEK